MALFVTDGEGRFLYGFDRRFNLLPRASFRAKAAAVASRLCSEGRIAPRTARSTPLGGAHLLSVMGDALAVHASYGQEPGPGESTGLLSAALALEARQAPEGRSRPPDGAGLSQVRGALLSAYLSPPPELAAPEPPAVFASPVLGAVGGRVRLELRLRNETGQPVSDVMVRFASPREALQPMALYGENAQVAGGEVTLLDALAPGERSLVLLLEPAAPCSGVVAVAVEYRDAGGRLRSAASRPLFMAATFPHLQRPEPRDLDDVVAAFARPDLTHDTWRMAAPMVVHASFAFARAKEAVERELPLPVFEFASERPAYYEAWYLAEVGARGPPVIVEASVWGEAGLVDLRVAATAPAHVMGALAEYRRRIRELLSVRFMGAQGPLASRPASAARTGPSPPGMHSTLLMQHLQGTLTGEEVQLAVRDARAWDASAVVELVEATALPAQEAPPAPQPADQAGRRSLIDPGRPDYFEAVPGLMVAFYKLVLPELAARAASLDRRAVAAEPPAA